MIVRHSVALPDLHGEPRLPLAEPVVRRSRTDLFLKIRRILSEG